MFDITKINLVELIFPIPKLPQKDSSCVSFSKQPISESIDAIWCGFDFHGDYIKEAIHRIKNTKEFSLVDEVAMELYLQMQKFWNIIQHQNSIESVDLQILFSSIFQKSNTKILITFVPKDPSRSLERGYHPPELITNSLVDIIQNKSNFDISNIESKPVFFKKYSTESQSDLNKLERSSNLKGAFGVDASVNLNHWDIIIIIDDISTTTATLCECGDEIKSLFTKPRIFGVCAASN